MVVGWDCDVLLRATEGTNILERNYNFWLCLYFTLWDFRNKVVSYNYAQQAWSLLPQHLLRNFSKQWLTLEDSQENKQKA